MPNSITINIFTQAPTFDLTEWEITKYNYEYGNYEDKIIFCKSKQVFKFDKCKGMIMPRSRVLRGDKEESELVEDVISATIDSGFIGHLVFKIRLTYEGFFKLTNGFSLEELIQNCVQIDLNPFPKNYYQGTNQTELEPEVVFCGEDERFTKINNILQELQKIISQLESSMKRAFSLVNVHWKK